MNKNTKIKHNIVSLVEHTINWMNSQQVYLEDYPYIKGGALHKIVERRITETAQYVFPKWDIIHPNDNSGLPDTYSQKYEKGIEIKCTFGWATYSYRKDGTKVMISEDGNVVWENSTTQTSTEYFLFIKLKLLNGLLVAERIYFGKLSYSMFKKKPGSKQITIRESIVQKICKRLK